MTTYPHLKFALKSRDFINKLVLLAACLLSVASIKAQTNRDTFNYTGSVQTWVVPASVTSIVVEAIGADGGSAPSFVGPTDTAQGGYVRTNVSVTPGQTINIYVGGAGTQTTAGWNGGGAAASQYGGGGGGASDIRIGGTALTDRIVVAGGAGGSAFGSYSGVGGAGGGLTGGAGFTGNGFTGGGGGTQSAGGSAGCCYGAATSGSFGVGAGPADYHNAGGGGGWYGGGSGAGHGGAGGGSSYTNATLCTNVIHIQGDTNSISNGVIYITYCLPNITLQPINSGVCDGTNTSFTVSTNSTGISYLWQVNTGSGFSNVSNGTTYANATTDSLSVNAVSSMNGYQYRACIISVCLDTLYSDTVTLSVYDPQVDSIRNDTICAGDTARLMAYPSTGATIEWYDSLTGGTNIASGDTLLITGATTFSTYYAQANVGATGNDTIQTPYNTNNGQRGAMFDVVPSKDITVTGFDANIYTGTTSDYQIYYKVGTHVGFETNASAWIPLDTVTSLTSLGTNVPTPMGFNISVPLQANTRYAFYITNTFGGGLHYTDGNAVGNYLAGNGDVTIYEGVGKSYPFALTLATRNVNATMHYSVSSVACSSSRTAVSLTVNDTPSISSHPVNSTICIGNSTYYKVSATGTGLMYQWQVNTGSSWSTISNGGIYSGATTDSLILSAPTASEDGNLYRCLVSGVCSNTAISDSAILTVNTAPSIVGQPNDSTICETGNAAFILSASSIGFTYQWQVNTGSGWSSLTNGGVYSNVTDSVLLITSAIASMDGYLYRCIASSACSTTDTSDSVMLTVRTALVITSQPSNSIICNGDNTSYKVTATGHGLTYQWEVNTGSGWSNVTNGGIYSGATTDSLILTAANTTYDGYDHRCVINGTCTPSVTSNTATLTVYTAPNITGQPTDTAICTGTNASFNVTATGHGLTYQWQVNTGSVWTDLTNGGIYSGVTTTMLNLTGATTGNINGVQYRCVISGTCSPTDTTSIATLTIQSVTIINSQPTNKTICAGNDTYYKVSGAGTGVTYQWEVNTGSGWSNISNGGIYSGATTDSLALTAVTTAYDGHQYRCVVSGICGAPSNSSTVSLTVNNAPIVTAHPSNSTICESANTSFSVTASGAGTTYQWQVDTGNGWNNISNGGIYSNATAATLNLTGATATYDGYQYRCVIGGTCTPGTTSDPATLTVNIYPTVSGQPTNKTICSGNNTYYKVTASGTGVSYQWQVNTGSGWNNVSNSGIYSGATTDSLALTAATATYDGYQYRCVVSGTCGSPSNSNAASLAIDVSPAITSDPANRVICEHTNTSFSVVATGTAVTYQWEVNTGSGWNNISNGGIYSGAATAALSLTGATTIYDGYQYRCVVSGTCTPNVTSNAATLTIQTAPVVVGHPVSSTICNGNNTYYKVTATGTGLMYQWQVNTGTGWTNLSNGGIYSGATTDSLVLTSATTAYDGYQYRCIISGTCSPSVTSNVASLTIDTAPTITSQPVNRTICDGANTTFGVSATGTALTYQWQVNAGSGWNNISNGGIYSNATTSTLTLTGVTTSNSGYQYRVVVNGTCSPSATSVAATLTVNSLPSISVNPLAKTICDGNNTSYTVTASGTGISYQWQVNTGSGWSNISNGGIYGGATTSLLTLTSASTSYNGYQYRVVVSGTCTPPATSSAADLTVYPIVTPTVSINSSATTICATTSVTFTVSSSTNGGSSPSYQWKVNGNNVGSNSTTYTTTSLSNGDIVTCVMTTSAPCPTSTTATSNGITMTVHPLLTPTINITSATGDSVCNTRTATFTANITNGGSAPVYQWKVNGNNVGTNTNTYATNTLTNGDVVSCELTSNALCASPNVVNSNKINMRVIPLSFASANITATPDVDICEGDKVVVYCYYTNGGINPKFEWYLNGSLQASSTSGSYTTTNFSDNDAIYCVYTNGNVCPEPVTTNTEVMTVHQTVSPSVSIIASSGTVIAPGWTVTFTAQPTNGGTNPTYAWRKNGQFIPGETGVTYTDNNLNFGDKIDVVMKGDWLCKDKEYSMSNVMSVNIPANVANPKGIVQELELYPNPNKGTFNLKGILGKETGEARVYILNELGQKVYEARADVTEGRIEQKFNMPNSLSAGMYMLSIEINGARAQKRFSIIE